MRSLILSAAAVVGLVGWLVGWLAPQMSLFFLLFLPWCFLSLSLSLCMCMCVAAVSVFEPLQTKVVYAFCVFFKSPPDFFSCIRVRVEVLVVDVVV